MGFGQGPAHSHATDQRPIDQYHKPAIRQYRRDLAFVFFCPDVCDISGLTRPATTLGDPPTVRAIKEHFIKVKIDLKKANAGPEATPSKSAAGASPDKTFPVTPSTGGKKRSAAAKSPQSRKKRKGGMSEESEASMTGEETDAMQGVEEDIVSPRVMPGRRTKTGVVVKEESTDDESGVGEKSEATSGEDSEGSTFKEQQE